MSHIDDLIQQLCPSGVEFKRLGDVVRIRNGRDYKHLGAGDVPVYGSGGVMTRVDTAVYKKPSVLIPRKGSLNKLYYVDIPFWTVDTIFYTEIGDRLIPRFFYYFLAKQHLEELNQAGGVPSLTQTVLNEIKIPVPPIEVQREIVRVLDLFGGLAADLATQLDAELKNRQRQHACYRDRLFAFPEAEGVRRVPMGELGEIFRGKRFTKADYVPEGGVACIHYGEIYTDYGTVATRTVSRVRADLGQSLRFARKGDVVLTDVGETVEDVGKAVAWLGNEEAAIHDHCYVIRSSVNPTYLSYYMQTAAFRADKGRYVARTKVKTLLLDGLKRIVVPVPAQEEQERIVSILEKFKTPIADLSVALPAEVNARRKQYEHYRDRLLTFKELAA